MVYRLADNVLSPLGMTTEENYKAVEAGRSALRRYDGLWGLPEPFTASLFSAEQTVALQVEGLTRFESLAARSAQQAIADAGITVSRPDVVFILSTTKGNIELLGQGSDATVSLSGSAQRIACWLGFTTTPLVVCNACISGVAAIILAQRLLEAGQYREAVVCGADVQNAFTMSGFQSLKAVAVDDCRPFDIERLGLNLGEAAATLVLTREQRDDWAIRRGVVRNDGYHISSPSKHGEGAYEALTALHADADTLAFVNAHGTATMFNDQMESVAIERAGLGAVPVNALKGYYGHTMGAAGILETVLSMAAADHGVILATRGYEECGVSGKIRLSATHGTTDRHAFVKMISGFGGGNAALWVARKNEETETPVGTSTMTMLGHLSLSAADGLLSALYKQYVGDYPKFYKMDGLSRLGFVVTEMLFRQLNRPMPADTAVILFNHSSSVAADRKYLESIADPQHFFPSPSVFVYTLPNIVTGEIAIRHALHGETSFYILPEKDERLMHAVVAASLAGDPAPCVLTGWIDYEDDDHYEAEVCAYAN